MIPGFCGEIVGKYSDILLSEALFVMLFTLRFPVFKHDPHKHLFFLYHLF